MAFGGGMDCAALDGRQDAPARIMDTGGCNRSALRVAHGREIAVVGCANPSLARQVRAILAGCVIAHHGVDRSRSEVGFETLALAREAFAVEYRIVVRACADSMMRERGLMGVDESHSL